MGISHVIRGEEWLPSMALHDYCMMHLVGKRLVSHIYH
jgi:glutamyl/glutaminyl-tRNA synthetase